MQDSILGDGDCISFDLVLFMIQPRGGQPAADSWSAAADHYDFVKEHRLSQLFEGLVRAVVWDR